MLKDIKSRLIGETGEHVACDYLKKKGYAVLCLNFRSKTGEIDIIARDKETIVFVEVKSRTSKDPINPVFAIDKRKRTRIEKTCMEYLKMQGLKKSDVRFDVILVIKASKNTWDIEHIKGAFASSGRFFY